MRTGSVLLLLGCGVVFGWTVGSPAPGVSDTMTGTFSATSKSAVASHSADGARISARSQGWSSDETVLERQPDGHFYAEASVDSRPCRFLVDTGASIVALTAEDADAMGLQWDESALTSIGRGASGPVYGIPIVIDRMELGGFEARGVQAAIVPEGLDVSLLGQSFLSQLRGVQIDGDRMTLGSTS